MKKRGRIRTKDILTEDILLRELKDLSRKQVAKKYGVCLSTINNLVSEYDIKLPRWVKLSKERLEPLLDNYTQKEIAEMFNMTQAGVCKLIKHYGLTYKDHKYHSMWNDFKDYCQNVNPQLYKKMIEMEG